MSSNLFKKKDFIIILSLFIFFIIQAYPKGKEVDKNKKLKEEIISAYQSGGKKGVLAIYKKRKSQITDKFIVDFAEAGGDQRIEQWLKIALLLAQQNRNEKNLADVFYYAGEYFRLIGHHKNAIDYFDKALLIYIKINESVCQGNVYVQKGRVYWIAGSISLAFDMYDKALPIFEKAKKPLGQGNVYLSVGDICFHTGGLLNAIEMYKRAFHNYRKARDPIGLGHVCIAMGNLYFRFSEYKEAIEILNEALLFFKQAETPIGQGNVYIKKGEIYFKIGENSRAFEMYDKALSFFEKVRDPIGQGNVYQNKGNIYFIIGDNSKALEMYDKALFFFENIGALLGQGNVYSGKGDIFLRIGKISSAIDMYDKALHFFEKSGEPIGQGSIYLSKGNIYFYTGNNSKAIEMLNKALLFFEAVLEYNNQGYVFFKKGNIYYRTGENNKALEMYDKALSLFEKAIDPIGQGNVYLSKGNVYFHIGNNSKALEMYDKALLFYEKVEDSIGQGNVYKDIGNIYLRIGEYSKAIEMYDKSLRLLEKAGEPIGRGNIYLGKGDIYLRTGESSKALGMYDKSFNFFNKLGDIESESFALHGKAKVLVQLGEKEKAVEIFEKGIAKLERIRKRTTLTEMKMNYLRSVYNQYEETALFLLENDYYEKGFKYVEKMRARVFLDRLAEGMEKVDKGLSPELKLRKDRLVFKRANKKKEIAAKNEKKNKNRLDKIKLEKLRNELHKIEIEIDNLYIEIRQKNKNYASIFYPELIELKVLQKKILKNEEILLEYFVSKGNVYLFLVSRENFKVKKLEADRKKIDDAVKKYLDFVSPSQPIESRSNKNKIIKQLEDLYSFILKPVEKEIAGKKLIFAPDGQLAALPFEALVSSRNKKTRKLVFLIDEYPIKYIQSASVLSYLRSEYKSEVINDNLVAFGDPVYDYNNFKNGKPEKGSLARVRSLKIKDELKDIYRSRYVREGGTFDRLIGSRKEVRTIAELFDKMGQNPVVYLRDKATEKNAKSLGMNRFGYIHFGCHGLVGDEFQSLVLSQDIPGETEDGFFSFDEIMNCDYNAQLVVLSGCKTNLGKTTRGEGVIGLTRAVMYAGSPAVIASLWKVKDTATKELMVRFYKNLLEKGMEKSEALRQAKLELIKNKKYSSPTYWSAFVMYGE